MKNKAILFIIVILIALGGTWYFFVQLSKQIEEDFVASIPTDIKMDYENFKMNPIVQKVTIENIKVIHNSIPIVFNAKIAKIKRNSDE